MQLVANHCIPAAVAPLSKENVLQGQFSWEPKQSLQREVTVAENELQASIGKPARSLLFEGPFLQIEGSDKEYEGSNHMRQQIRVKP